MVLTRNFRSHLTIPLSAVAPNEVAIDARATYDVVIRDLPATLLAGPVFRGHRLAVACRGRRLYLADLGPITARPRRQEVTKQSGRS